MSRGYDRCMCGASDCSRCHPGSWNACETCNGEGVLTDCDECDHKDDLDEDGECAYKEREGCPVCPECNGNTPEDDREAAAEARWEARMDR
jgi:hypothetical protein